MLGLATFPSVRGSAEGLEVPAIGGRWVVRPKSLVWQLDRLCLQDPGCGPAHGYCSSRCPVARANAHTFPFSVADLEQCAVISGESHQVSVLPGPPGPAPHPLLPFRPA